MEKNQQTEVSADKILELIPPVAMIRPSGNYMIKAKEDLDDFLKGAELSDRWTDNLKEDSNLISTLLQNGLKGSVELFLNGIKTPRIYSEFKCNNDNIAIEMSAMLYRCIRELIMNAQKHANANLILVRLATYVSHVSATVFDNGISFDPKSTTIGHGLGNIADYVVAQNGIMRISTTSGAGTEINFDIELR